jgi:hypothetical protein
MEPRNLSPPLHPRRTSVGRRRSSAFESFSTNSTIEGDTRTWSIAPLPPHFTALPLPDLSGGMVITLWSVMSPS